MHYQSTRPPKQTTVPVTSDVDEVEKEYTNVLEMYTQMDVSTTESLQQWEIDDINISVTWTVRTRNEMYSKGIGLSRKHQPYENASSAPLGKQFDRRTERSAP